MVDFFDPTRALFISAIAGFAGTALVLSNLRWFSRPSLQTRLRPFSGVNIDSESKTTLSTFREVVTPLVASTGERLSKLFGVNDDLESRLRKAHLDHNVGAFRMRQFGWAGASSAVALLTATALQLAWPLAIFLCLSLPLLAFLILEQSVSSKVQARQFAIFAELPVTSEQLAMLLGAGYSLGAALNRLADRSQGIIGEDLKVVCDRVRQGLTTAEALKEWSTVADVPELSRLVSVLAFGAETTDLGRLVSNEAQTVRNEAQRRLAATIDKRAQQVWVPVTVATLVPGVIFLSIPFLHALRQFTSS